MVHAQPHYSFEIRQVRSRLFLIRHPRPRHLKKMRKDLDEFLEEISKLKSVPEIISRIDDYLKQIKEEISDLDLAKAIIVERMRIRSIEIAELRTLKQTLLRKN
ncbi:PREDICTED: uncharacterized protein LOC104765772 [Camelina sativa]|uniref:Uncharacterized protein LOC104765772 n=1 Tax=Camelina sativa TaxID=90675 RepID=A0ABM0XLT8_CAMSA|nr:PREDICTED: uncharacterized protein LOC104765772 [Camelina sativa]